MYKRGGFKGGAGGAGAGGARRIVELNIKRYDMSTMLICRPIMFISVFIQNIMESSSNESKNEEFYISSQDILTCPMEIH